MKRLSVSERRRQSKRISILIWVICIIGIIGVLWAIISYFTNPILVSGVSVRDSGAGVLVKYTLKNRTNKPQVVTLDIILYARDMSLFPKVPDAVLVSEKKQVRFSMHPKEVRAVETIVSTIWPVVRQSVSVVSCKEKVR